MRMAGGRRRAASYEIAGRRLLGLTPRLKEASSHPPPLPRRNIMGKYFLAWLLGVPGLVLLLVYLFFH